MHIIYNIIEGLVIYIIYTVINAFFEHVDNVGLIIMIGFFSTMRVPRILADYRHFSSRNSTIKRRRLKHEFCPRRTRKLNILFT